VDSLRSPTHKKNRGVKPNLNSQLPVKHKAKLCFSESFILAVFRGPGSFAPNTKPKQKPNYKPIEEYLKYWNKKFTENI